MRKYDVTVLLRINARGVHLIFGIFFFLGGAYIQGRRLLQNTEKITILYINVNDFVVFFYPKNGIICFIKTSESVIRLNWLGRSGSSNTSSCDINCSLQF